MTLVRLTKLKPGEIISLNYDFIFTTIFNKESNIDLLESFIASYFEIPLEKVKGKLKIMKRRIDLNNKNEAGKEIDLLLNYEGRKINIELSNSNSKENFLERNIVYACSIHSSQLKYKDNSYKNIRDTIQINLNSRISNKNKVKESYYIRGDDGEVLSENFRIDMVDVAKGSQMWYPNINNKLIRWCKALLAKTEDELKEALGDNIMENTSRDKLLEELVKISSDDEYLGIYTELSKAEMERNTAILNAEERSLKRGVKQGLKRGIKQGITQGITQRNLEMAREMLQENIDIALISKLTKLSIGQIEGLKQ